MCSVCLLVTAADLTVHSNSRNTAGREADDIFKNAWGYTAIPPDIFGEWSYTTLCIDTLTAKVILGKQFISLEAVEIWL
jgi:hypothetical protein